MDSFSIDDVGEHFRDDIRGVLAAIAPRLDALLAQAPPPNGLPQAELGAVEDACHTVAGSAALVGATALVTGSTVLGRLIGELRQTLIARDAAVLQLRRLTTAAIATMPGLGDLLELELTKERAAAETLAQTLDQRATRAISGVDPEPLPETPVKPRAANAEDPEAFSFFDEPASGTPSAPATARSNAEDETLFALVAEEDHGIDPEIREAFTIEAGELLDTLDRHALALERGAPPAATLREIFRVVHTLKGAANTVGFTAIGAAAHRAEDHLEGWDANRLDARAAATALLRIQRALRAAFVGEAPAPDPTWVTQELERVVPLAADAADHEVTLHEPVAQLATATVGGAMGGAMGGPVAGERRALRVTAEQLDRLMRLAGELVITRSRLTERVALLTGTQRELAASRSRLVTTVDTFCERHEFSGLDGRRNLPIGRGVMNRARGALVEDQFTDLELDRYEDIHVLARSLGEITGDIGELQGEIQVAVGDIGEDSEAIGRAVNGIQSEIAHARLIPLDGLFARLRLAVQDAADRAGKGVRVEQHGGDVALDKTLVDGLQTPVLHLVRNAVAHGVEKAENRILEGKPPDGRITLVARQEGGQIILTIADDGGGLDLPRLHRRGVELGLIDAQTPLDSPLVPQLVFAAGLSTTAHADAVSGRGFGCDVAREELQRLGGTLTVASEPGRGTTFTITLPLTLAISRALLVETAGGRYAVPMNFVEHIIDLDEAALSLAGGVRRVTHGDSEIRLLDLGAALGLRATPDTSASGARRGAGLLVRLGEQRWVLQVDVLLRQEDVVVSGLGDLLTGHPLFAGVVFPGATGLVPIIDLPGLLTSTAPRPSAPRSAMRPTATLTARSGPRSRRVLFVDDSLSVRRVAEQLLRGLGVDVVLAVDGEDALAKLRSTTVDLVFTDLEMPRMHGYDLLRELRFVPAHRDLPVVVVTSRSGDKHRALAEQLGAQGYLTKPFTAEQLSTMLEQLVPGLVAK